MNILLLKGLSSYGALHIQIDQAAAAFRSLGHDVTVADFEDSVEGEETVQAALAQRVDFCFALNAICADVAMTRSSFGPLLDTAYVTAIVDHPIYHQERLQAGLPHYVVCTIDPSHLDFLEAWAGPGKYAATAFVPPGGNKPDTLPDMDVERYFAERDIPILFTGTYRGAPRRVWADWEPNLNKDLMETATELVLDTGTYSVEEAVREVLDGWGIELESEKLAGLLSSLTFLHRYIEAYRRHEMLVTLGKAGVPLSVYGNGWEPLCEAYPSFQYGGIGSVEETLGLLRRSRICLSTNNNFIRGGHERVFTAMCNGAAVVSEASTFYESAFVEDQEIVLFRWRELRMLPTMLNAVLKSPERLHAIAQAGHRKALEEHTWVSRARDILELVEKVGPRPR
ncbi:MAG TPA: glycosyltransferase [Azospirillum sp.]|nr:glycosyltransferase [Azospirillum sp.]